MTNTQFIAKTVPTAAINIQKTVQLLNEDCTIPFISRYRKDQTGNLDEVVIEQIAKLNKQYDEIVKRKESILKTIEEQGQLSPELAKKIQDSFDLQELEDLYLPFKKKKKPRRMSHAKMVWSHWLKSSWRKTMMTSILFRHNTLMKM
jgi:uncharacterized protein